MVLRWSASSAQELVAFDNLRRISSARMAVSAAMLCVLLCAASPHIVFAEETPTQEDQALPPDSVNPDPATPDPGAPDPAVTDAALATPTPELDQSFLLLPSYDLENTQAGKPIRVGDTSVFKLQGDLKNLPQGEDLQLRLPPGVEDQSTTVSVDEKTSGEDRHFNVTAVKAGVVTLPSFGLADSTGKFIARTNPIQLTVESSIAKTDPKPKEAAPPLPPSGLGLPLTTLIFLAVLILCLVGLGVYGLVRWSRKRRLLAPEKPKAPPRPEDEVALEALAALEKKGLLKQGLFKAHYFGISEILKHYLGARYRFDAAESTTEELLRHLDRESGVAGSILDGLKEGFEKLDRVKFTDFQPVAIEGTELLEQARKVVQSTKRPPTVASVGTDEEITEKIPREKVRK